MRLEQITGYDLSDNFSASEPHPFWSSQLQVKLEHRLICLIWIIHYMRFYITMKASKYIANSADYENGLYPDAKFIYNEREEAVLKAQLVDIKAKFTNC